MANKDQKQETLQDIPTSSEESTKQKKLKAAPDEVLAKAIHEMLLKDQGGE
ncbi:hypothetical protein [Butyrivibrio sp. AE3004]|uniref:hypothetical protein n=1 Tax=Butyrivibrio sp. AE3004 TaxID=1506994 RepID=UPI0012DC3B79|nr:hypothetical protein [Butyrivibrio sp. AE3004]